MGTRTPGVQAAVATWPAGGRVLDAACGTGFDALALHRRGFRVTATDASAGMVDRCRARLAAAGATVPVQTCAWADLPEHVGRSFDVVLCTGNSLAHAPTRDERRAALAGFAAVLVDGGTLVLDTQDWARLLARGDHVVDDPLVVTRNGRSCRRRLAWHVPERPGGLVVLRLTLRFADGARVHHEVRFLPFAVEELMADLGHAGFTVTEQVQVPGDDRFTVVARAVRRGGRGPAPR